MKQKECVLITAADKNYLEQAKQLFSSVYYNSGWPGDYMLLSYDIPEKDLKWFRDKGIIVRKISNSLKYQKKSISRHSAHWNSVVAIKFHAFDRSIKKWKNVLFLDSDIIVRSSLDKLTKVKGLWAVQDHLLKLEKQFYIKSEYKKDNGLTDQYNLRRSAFNSGVMAFSTDIIKANTLEGLEELYEKYRSFNLWGDQGILNLYFYKRWKRLPKKYNFYAPDYKEGYESAAVIFHNIGQKKIPKDKPVLYHEWNENLEKAEFIDLRNRPKGKKQKNRVKGFRYLLLISLEKRTKEAKLRADRYIGKVGLLIKKTSPKTYILIKKLLRFK